MAVKIVVENEVGSVTYPANPRVWINMTAGGFEGVELLGYSADSDDELLIKAYTRRGHIAYYRYLVP